MKIDVHEIPDDGSLDVELSEKRESVSSFFGRGDVKLARFESPVKGFFHLSRSGETVFIDLRFECSLMLVCSRCLEEFLFQMCEESHLVLSPEGKMLEGEQDDEETVDRDYYVGEAVDLGGILAEEASLVMPYNPLCRESCKGLCGSCGKNLNEGKCSCIEDELDERLSVLKNFKIN